MAEFIKVVNHGAKQMDLRHIGATAMEVTPIELHYNKNGSTEDKPTFCMVLSHPSGLKVFGQFSLKTLQDCLNELGYQIHKP